MVVLKGCSERRGNNGGLEGKVSSCGLEPEQLPSDSEAVSGSEEFTAAVLHMATSGQTYLSRSRHLRRPSLRWPLEAWVAIDSSSNDVALRPSRPFELSWSWPPNVDSVDGGSRKRERCGQCSLVGPCRGGWCLLMHSADRSVSHVRICEICRSGGLHQVCSKVLLTPFESRSRFVGQVPVCEGESCVYEKVGNGLSCNERVCENDRRVGVFCVEEREGQNERSQEVYHGDALPPRAHQDSQEHPRARSRNR